MNNNNDKAMWDKAAIAAMQSLLVTEYSNSSVDITYTNDGEKMTNGEVIAQKAYKMASYMMRERNKILTYSKENKTGP